MAKGIYKLSALDCKNARCDEGKSMKRLPDGGSLYLQVMSSGSKSWVWTYGGNKKTALGLGNYPAVSLAAARDEADWLRCQRKLKLDPAEQRRRRDLEIKKGVTFKEVSMEFLRETKLTVVEPKTYQNILSRLENHVFPGVGDIPIHLLKSRDVRESLGGLMDRGCGDALRKVCGSLNEIMNFAYNLEYIDRNPLKELISTFPKSKPRENRPSIPPSELPFLLRDIFASGSMQAQTQRLIMFQLQIMVRPCEAVQSAWADIDWDSQTLTIAANRIKKRREHIIPLSSQVVKILKAQKVIAGDGKYIFPSNRGDKPVGRDTVNKALIRIGYKGRQCAHGLRSIGATWMQEYGKHKSVIMSCLSHATGDSTHAAYDRSTYLDERRELMQLWSDEVSRCRAKGIDFVRRGEV